MLRQNKKILMSWNGAEIMAVSKIRRKGKYCNKYDVITILTRAKSLAITKSEM